MMEHLPASDANAITASLKLVDEADIYIGVLAHRYGYIPKTNNRQKISITEMEYNRAVERKMPRLIFIMDKAHPIAGDSMEPKESLVKLEILKERWKQIIQLTSLNHLKICVHMSLIAFL